MVSKKKLSSTEWFIFILVMGVIIILNAISLLETKGVDKKLKKSIGRLENKKTE